MHDHAVSLCFLPKSSLKTAHRQGRIQELSRGDQMASASLYNGVWAEPPAGSGQNSIIKLKAFQIFYAQRRAKIWSLSRDFSVFFEVVQ